MTARPWRAHFIPASIIVSPERHSRGGDALDRVRLGTGEADSASPGHGAIKRAESGSRNPGVSPVSQARRDLRTRRAQTFVLFSHEGWREPNEFMHHCSTKWATFLLSLKDLVENGKGSPEPRDTKIAANA
jgi:hypothetical protein